jgi:DNA processing protein
LRHAERLGQQIASSGAVVVSGGALGVDTAAHCGALEVSGQTIAVVGSGLSELYPRENEELFAQIQQGKGAVVSELPCSAPVRPENFPRRNRIIAGFSDAVIVVRGEARSGASYTAKAAREQGKRLYAVPGPAGDAQSQLPHRLLREGALLCEGAGDVLFDSVSSLQLSLFEAAETGPRLSGDAKKVFDALSREAEVLDLIAQRAVLPPARVSSALLELELVGLCVSHPGARYSRRQ